MAFLESHVKTLLKDDLSASSAHERISCDTAVSRSIQLANHASHVAAMIDVSHKRLPRRDAYTSQPKFPTLGTRHFDQLQTFDSRRTMLWDRLASFQGRLK